MCEQFDWPADGASRCYPSSSQTWASYSRSPPGVSTKPSSWWSWMEFNGSFFRIRVAGLRILLQHHLLFLLLLLLHMRARTVKITLTGRDIRRKRAFLLHLCFFAVQNEMLCKLPNLLWHLGGRWTYTATQDMSALMRKKTDDCRLLHSELEWHLTLQRLKN